MCGITASHSLIKISSSVYLPVSKCVKVTDPLAFAMEHVLCYVQGDLEAVYEGESKGRQ